VAQEGQREPRCTSLLVCHAAHAHPGSSHALRGARSDGTIHNDPLAVFVLTGLFARRFWLGWERTRHTAAVGKQALFMGETPRYTWTKEGVSVRRMCGRRSIPSRLGGLWPTKKREEDRIKTWPIPRPLVSSFPAIACVCQWRGSLEKALTPAGQSYLDSL
jgi:hypothetical protein